MDSDYYEQAEAYNLRNLLYAGLLSGAVLLAFYFLWSWCSDSKENDDRNQGHVTSSDKGRLSMKPVYAHEIEPGIVVLQSEDGEYFKILKEYNLGSGTANQYGSFSCTRPENAQPRLQTRLERQTVSSEGLAVRQFQGQGPSAPLMFDSGEISETSGTIFGDSANRPSETKTAESLFSIQ